MKFFHVPELKIVFGVSPKAGSTHVKYLMEFFRSGMREPYPHKIFDDERNALGAELPEFPNHFLFIFLREPRARLLSGFLDKYSREGEFRAHWHWYHEEPPTFAAFVSAVAAGCPAVDTNHFAPQWDADAERVRGCFSAECTRVFDIARIDYGALLRFFGRPHTSEWEDVIQHKWGHEHVGQRRLGGFLGSTPIDLLVGIRVDLAQFYDAETSSAAKSIYTNDFAVATATGF